MNKKDLAEIKKLLIEKKAKLLNKTNNTQRDIDSDDTDVGDEIDTARHSSDKEMFFEIAAVDKIILYAVNDALAKIEKNTYGKCECCGEAISVERLKAIPWTRYCIKCQEEAENSKR
ncbi:MAG: TraR/DksA family transcriptional regulator [Endomicrobium sp.]|jgi:DnaK suppressor protein|nr:TraR/DksA family transcriptional regulator [Endomicrobium sp.]